jgi:flagellar basal body-associated protein FliL
MAAASATGDGRAKRAVPDQGRRVLRLRLRPYLLAAGGLATVAVVGLLAAAALSPDPGVVEIEIGGELVYHGFPDIIADLKDEGRRPRYVKLGIIVELPAELRPRLEASRTAIVDALHAYLRERRAEELVGEAGADRVREALTGIVNQALAPDEARAVLFRQFILN